MSSWFNQSFEEEADDNPNIRKIILSKEES